MELDDITRQASWWRVHAQRLVTSDSAIGSVHDDRLVGNLRGEMCSIQKMLLPRLQGGCTSRSLLLTSGSNRMDVAVAARDYNWGGIGRWGR